MKILWPGQVHGIDVNLAFGTILNLPYEQPNICRGTFGRAQIPLRIQVVSQLAFSSCSFLIVLLPTIWIVSCPPLLRLRRLPQFLFAIALQAAPSTAGNTSRKTYCTISLQTKCAAHPHFCQTSRIPDAKFVNRPPDGAVPISLLRPASGYYSALISQPFSVSHPVVADWQVTYPCCIASVTFGKVRTVAPCWRRRND